MTAARYRAYRRALAAVDELAGVVLAPTEHGLLRDAAEGLLLTREDEESEQEATLDQMSLALLKLVRARRISAPQSEQLFAMIAACGPERPAGVMPEYPLLSRT